MHFITLISWQFLNCFSFLNKPFQPKQNERETAQSSLSLSLLMQPCQWGSLCIPHGSFRSIRLPKDSREASTALKYCWFHTSFFAGASPCGPGWLDWGLKRRIGERWSPQLPTLSLLGLDMYPSEVSTMFFPSLPTHPSLHTESPMLDFSSVAADILHWLHAVATQVWRIEGHGFFTTIKILHYWNTCLAV